MLTELTIKRAKPRARDYKMFDAGGLYLYVTTKGFKSWRLKYRFAGKEKRLTFGAYPEMSLTEAREKRDTARKLLRDGRDPAIERKLLLVSAATAAETTFEKIAREWHAINKSRWTETHAWDVLHSLEVDAFPSIGSLPIGAIEPPLILNACLRSVEARGAIETAHRIQQRISQVYRYAIATGVAKTDPAAMLKGALLPIIKGRQPAVTDLDAARGVLRDVEAMPGHPVTKLGHRLLALTAVRPGTLAETPWTEFADLDPVAPVWRIPPARMKLRKEHKSDSAREHWVPLARQAVDVIAELRKLTGRGPYVLPNARFAHKPMSENALSFMLKRAGYHGVHVPHGWRATFSTVMNERFKADRHIIDLMLAHVPKDKVEGAYNRAAYFERRTELAQIWADLLIEGLPPADAILSSRRRGGRG